MTTAEFERRCAAARSYTHGPGLRMWIPGLAGLAMMLAYVAIGERRVPAAVGISGMVLFLVFSFASGAVDVARGRRAPSECGLLCAGCGSALIGGQNDERTAHVRRRGCCLWCGAAVLDDHAGARDAAAREAALAQAPPHPSAFARDDFDRRFAACRQGMDRRRRIFLLAVAAVPPALVGAMFPPLDGGVRMRILQAGVLFIGVVVVWQLLGVNSVARRLGIRCPACRKVPLGSLDVSVIRTGLCPHCSAVLILPAR